MIKNKKYVLSQRQKKNWATHCRKPFFLGVAIIFYNFPWQAFYSNKKNIINQKKAQKKLLDIFLML